jgi:ribosomal-protein-alanine N-acetyltransferase
MSPSQNKPFNIRELTSADATWMAELHRSCFAEPQQWNADALCSLMVLKTNTSLGLMVNHTGVGFIIGSLVADEGEVLTLAIHPDHRRNGYAKLLIERLIEEGRPRGLEKIFLEVIETNTPAIKLYGALGFEIISRRTDYYRMPEGHAKKHMDGLVLSKTLS